MTAVCRSIIPQGPAATGLGRCHRRSSPRRCHFRPRFAQRYRTSVAEKPASRLCRPVGEELDIAPFRRSLDLHARKSLTNHDRDLPRLRGRVVEHPLKFDDRVLRLDEHLPHIDQREMPILAALELAVRFIPGGFERLNVSRSEESAHLHRDKIEGRINNDGEVWNHSGSLNWVTYQRVERAGYDGELAALGIAIKDVARSALKAISGCICLVSWKDVDQLIPSRPVAKQGEVIRSLTGGHISWLENHACERHVGRHSALSLSGWRIGFGI